MANNPRPDFLSEVMFQEHGTRVLITDPAADRYLERHRQQKMKIQQTEDSLKSQYPQWFDQND